MWVIARLRCQIDYSYRLHCLTSTILLVVQDMFTFARCKAPLPISLLQKTGVPQPAELVEVLEKDLEWEEFQVRLRSC